MVHQSDTHGPNDGGDGAGDAMTMLMLAQDFPPIGGGIARMAGEIARRFPPDELVVSTAMHRDAPDTDPEFGAVIDRLPVPFRRTRNPLGLLMWGRRAATLTRRHRVSFVICTNYKPPLYPARWVYERTRVPYGVVFYGGELLGELHKIHLSRLKRETARALLRTARVYLPISAWTRDLVLTLLGEVGLDGYGKRVRILHPGTEPTIFRPGLDPEPLRSRYRLPAGRWLVTVARLTAHKGIDTAIRALARLAPSRPQLRYAVAGTGPYRATLESLAAELGVADRLHLLGAVPDRDLPALYNLADVYLGVSRRERTGVEGFGLALVEASACGVPVVGGMSGGIPDAVKHGETGLLVSPESDEGLAGAIAELLDDPALARRLGVGGRTAVERYFNWDRVVRQLREMAAEMAPRRRRRRGEP